MSNNGEVERVNLGLLLKVSLAILGVGALLALCIWVTVQKPSSTTDVKVSTTAEPRVDPTIVGDDDTPPVYKEISEAEKPTDEQIWEFETAYVMADPAEKLSLLEKVATQQYISNEYSSQSIETNGLIVEVDRLTSVFTIENDPDKTHCFVTSHLNLNSFRDNEPVLSYQIKHTTLWVNTLEGWKAASEVR